MRRQTKVLAVWIAISASVAAATALVIDSLGRSGAHSGSDAVGERSPGTLRMVERLREVREAEERDAALETAGDGQVVWTVNRPSTIPTLRDAIANAKSFGDHLGLRHRLVEELVWAGRNEEALALCEEMHAIADRLNGRVSSEDMQGIRVSILAEQVGVRLRMAEDANCVCQSNGESCIFPLQGGGVHTRREAARDLIGDLTVLLSLQPDELSWRWLLNLSYMAAGEHPDQVPPEFLIPASIFRSDYPLDRFKDEAVERGAATVGLAGGCVLEDLDGDGDLDIMASGRSLDDQIRFLRNRGDGHFEDRTKEAGLEGIVGGLNLSHADYDNDGDADILVLRGGWEGDRGAAPNSLLRSNGDGTFDDVTEEAGLLVVHPGQVGVWGDFDNDGWLDVFLGHEDLGHETHPSLLYRNNGDGTFQEVDGGPALRNLGFVKGAAWGDYDNDGRIDLYVSRMRTLNVLLRNEGPASTSEVDLDGKFRWQFRDAGSAAGVGEPHNGFATWFFDYDNDGWLDLFVAGFRAFPVGDVAAMYLGQKIRGELPHLYRNRGDGTFADVSHETRVDRLLLTMGANYGDLDNDGWLDFYAGTGTPDLRTLVPNRMFRNAGGRAFEDVTTSGGFGHLQKGHGIAFGDVDGDGDHDVYAVQGGWYSADRFRNCLFVNPGNENHWIKLRLRGTKTNRMALGARIRLTFSEKGQSRTVHDVVSTGGSFGSTTALRHIGLGTADKIDSIEISWPVSGYLQVLTNVAVDQTLEIREDAASGEPSTQEPRSRR